MTHTASRIDTLRPARARLLTLSTLTAHLLTIGACSPGPASALEQGDDGLPTGAPWGDEESGESSDGLDSGATPLLDLPVPDGEEAPCEVESYAWEPVHPQLMFVLDHSGSMGSTMLDPLGDPWTRWASLHEVVRLTLERREADVEFGLKVFPSPQLAGEDACGVETGVELTPQLMALESFVEVMPDAQGQPVGSTPLYAGLSAAGAVLEASDPHRPRAILLVADGGITTSCGPFEDPDIVSSAVGGLLVEHGIRTYVVAVGPQAAAATSLQSVAVAGGTGEVFSSGDSLELDAAIGSIVDEVRSCEVQLQAPYPEAEVLRPIVGEVELELTDDCDAGEGGFTYDALLGRITLCPEPCEAYFDGAAVEVEDACQPD